MLQMKWRKNISKKQLARIKKPNKKIYALLSYNSDKKVFKNNEDLWPELISMIEALEYHYKNHCVYERKIERGQSYYNARFEAIAYLNAMGRIYYFFTSEWLHASVCPIKSKCLRDGTRPCEFNTLLRSEIPTLLALIPLRNKIAAHRQQDRPWKDDIKSLGFNCFGLLPSLEVSQVTEDDIKELENLESQKLTFDELKKALIGKGYRIRYSFATNQREVRLDSSAIKGIEYLGKNNGGNNNVIIFKPAEHHSKIIKEIIKLTELLFSHD
jgi:hypothetical protein